MKSVFKSSSDSLKPEQPSKLQYVEARSDVFMQPKQGVVFRIQTEKGSNKFEVMSSSIAQHYVINENFSDILCLITPYPPYLEASFMGFLLMLPEQLLDTKKNEELYKALKADFGEITRLLPKSVVGLMRRVALYINVDSDSCVTGLCFHRDRSWLGG